MAVTIISKPNDTDLYSVSYPVNVVLSSDEVGTPDITQHKFYMEFIIDGISIGTKFFVAISGNEATSNMSSTVKNYVSLSKLVDHPVQGIIELTQLCQYPEVLELFPPPLTNVLIKTGETYYDAGVFTENIGAEFEWIATRGFSENSPVWELANYTDTDILTSPATYQIPYSGYEYAVFPINLQRFLAGAGLQYFKFNFYSKVNGVESLAFTKEIDTDTFNNVVYVPLFFDTYTNVAKFQSLRIEILTGATSPATTPLYQYVFPKTIEYCGERMWTLMYQDQFFQWAFYSFTMKSYVSLEKSREVFEGQNTGRIDFNLKLAKSGRVSTDLVPESFNKYFYDLFESRNIFIVGNQYLADRDTPAVAFPYNLRITLSNLNWEEKTIRSNKLVSYTFEFKKSVNEFIP